MAAGISTRTGAAQLSALSRVQRAAQHWDFAADVSAAEELAALEILDELDAARPLLPADDVLEPFTFI